MSEKRFTLNEARNLVPWLQETFDGLAPLRDRIKRLQGEIDDIVQHGRSNGGSHAEGRLQLTRRALSELAEALTEELRRVLERGILVRSVDRPLVDFPSTREGREVYLCWLDGEADITFWHETDTGFAGRQPL
jgi:hypothetical protein